MGYWTDKANSEGQSAEQMPNGYHRAKCKKVLRGKKDGPGFKSKNGDPQLMAVFVNANGEEAATMFTLSDRAAWVMAKFLGAAGANLEKMDEAGITINRFEDPEFAEKQMLDRECWINVEWKPGSNDKMYANIEFVKEDDVPIHVMQNATAGTTAGPHEPLTDDDIPF